MNKLLILFVIFASVQCRHGQEQDQDQVTYLKDRPIEDFDEIQVYRSPEFKQQIDKNFFASQDKNTIWSVDIRAFGPKGEKILLYTYNSKTLVRPASLNKILTIFFNKILSLLLIH